MDTAKRCRAAESFVREFMHRFWSNDFAYFEKVLAVWIAAQEDQYRLDRDESVDLYRNICQSTPEVVLVDESYEAIASEGGVTVVTGWYYGINNPEMGSAFGSRQRLTVILRDLVGDQPFEIVHLHMSNPVTISRKGEYFPVGFSREAYRYVRMLASQYSDRESIEVREIGGATHVLRTFDVVYLEADRQYTMIHCLSKTLRARQGIGELSKKCRPVLRGAARKHREHPACHLVGCRFGPPDRRRGDPHTGPQVDEGAREDRAASPIGDKRGGGALPAELGAAR